MQQRPAASAPRSTQRSAPPVLVRTEHFVSRSARPSDASPELAEWFADPAKVEPLNMAPRQLSVPELRRFIETFDNRNAVLILMIPRGQDAPCGLFHSEINRLHRVSRVSYLSGSRTALARRAFLETAPDLLRFQFQKLGVEKVVAQVPVTNPLIARHLERVGFQREGLLRSQVRSIQTGDRLDQWSFGLLPEDLGVFTTRLSEPGDDAQP